MGYEIVNAAVVNTFTTFSIAYPVAVRDTIWLGERDDYFAREYTLGGVATGNVSTGGEGFSQLLDGAAGDGVNYGIECCFTVNSVTIADADWGNQRKLFDLPGSVGGLGGSGILFDPTDATLWLSGFGDKVTQFSLTGDVLAEYSLAGTGSLVALAYESLTDTFWATDKAGAAALVNFDRTGAVLSRTVITGASIGNVFGGGMAVTSFGGGDGAVIPLPAAIWGLLLGLGGLGGLGIAARRRRA